MFNIIKQLASPRRFYHFCGILVPVSTVLFILALGYGLFGGLWLAPADYQQGEGFRIIYIHVPAAILSLMLYSVLAFYSGVYLIWRIKIADVIANSIAPIGTLFTVLALLTGAIWGKPMWGTWWIWDARLTSELILLFLYLGYMGLRQAIDRPKVAQKACAILAIVGFIDIPIIHYSVKWWTTLHQGSSLMGQGAPTIHPSMLMPLLSMLLAFISYSAWMGCQNIRTQILQNESHTLWVKALFSKEVA